MTVLSFIEFEKTPPGVQTGNDYAPIYALAHHTNYNDADQSHRDQRYVTDV